MSDTVRVGEVSTSRGSLLIDGCAATIRPKVASEMPLPSITCLKESGLAWE